ncbi:IS4 family transposase [Frisingicoccus sp.]|uniref:IS4 family transposase n=1 Tax=Frisingicoccus sp. TaxID=1918627 RepID=UPI002A7FE10F|nr:IS4 family transposase [Frisingicoccus sp.]MDY4921454.1 IS4 family transposase [Frisingicoccus sp.]MDY5956483.1 IS4 family transposase [Frisingicoccus sp.]
MNDFPEKVKQKLHSIMTEISEHHWLFSKNPKHDFMRQNTGKLSLYDTMHLILTMGKGNTSDEIIDYFDLDYDAIPTNSAFIQRRNQIMLSAFEYLFSEFSSSFPEITRKFKGHSILAVDGTHVCYTTNAQITEDYSKPHRSSEKGYNHMHLNALVDALSKVVIDAVIQPGQQSNERGAFHSMLDHFTPEDPSKYILTADRGYESYDLIFHCESRKLSYVFRVKGPQVTGSILSSFKSDLPDEQEEFDVIVRRFLTDKKNTIIKKQTDVYIYMNPSKNIPHFYTLLGNNHVYVLQLRVVKIKTGEDSYEYLISNLPYDPFSSEDMKWIYHFRWNCEVSFRYLKHAAGMLYFHSKKPEFIKQEIYASLTLYNFGMFIANAASDENQKKKRNPDNKYIYEIDFSNTIKTVRKYLLHKDFGKPVDLIRLVMKYVHAVKEEFRHFERHLRSVGAICLNYR